MSNMTIAPREYQLEAIEAIKAARMRGVNRQLVSLPTGTGKTIIFSLLARQLNAKTLILAHTEELIGQAATKFSIVWPESDVGIVRAEKNESDRQVVIASIQTARQPKRLEQLKARDFDLLIVDECHHAASGSYINVFDALGFFSPHEINKKDYRISNHEKLLVGLTATPARGDKVGLYPIFQEIVFEKSLETMIRAGYLSPLVGLRVDTQINIQGVEVNAGDFVVSQLSKILNTQDRNQIVVENFKRYASERRRTLVFCCDVQHSKDLAAAFVGAGVKAAPIYGEMGSEERKRVLHDFASGSLQVLTNCQLLTEGFDQADIDCVLLARPTYSSGLYMQMVGRGTRLHPGKKDCLIIDFTDNCAKHSLCSFKNTLKGAIAPYFGDRCDDAIDQGGASTHGEIGENNPISEARFQQTGVQEIVFFQKAHFAWVPVGDSWHLRLSADRDVWVRQVDGGFLVVAYGDQIVCPLSSRPLPLDYALGVAEDWARSQTTQSAWARKDAPWRMEPATQKQIDALKKSKVKFNYGITKGEAAQILDGKFNAPASEPQKNLLRKRGISFDPNLSKAQAHRLIGGGLPYARRAY